MGAVRAPGRAMDVPVHCSVAAGAAIAPPAAGPWRLVKPDMVDLPDAARAGEEGERHRAADRQQLGRPDDWHADRLAGRAGVPGTAAAEARRGKAAVGAA